MMARRRRRELVRSREDRELLALADELDERGEVDEARAVRRIVDDVGPCDPVDVVSVKRALRRDELVDSYDAVVGHLLALLPRQARGG
jgi:hypothetical protein